MSYYILIIMEASYETRYGTLAGNVCQLHCILIANQHISWFIPTGQNHISWEPSGWKYIMDLYREHHQTNSHSRVYNNLELFVKALLQQELVIPMQTLWKHLNESQKGYLMWYFISHREDSILPVSSFGDTDRIQSSILQMNQSLWIGAGYTPTLYECV